MAVFQEEWVANAVHKFKDRDVQRVIKAARSAGLDPVAVEVDPKTGRIRVISSKAAVASNGNSWDEVLNNAANEKRPS